MTCCPSPTPCTYADTCHWPGTPGRISSKQLPVLGLCEARTQGSCLNSLRHTLWRTIGSSVVAIASWNPMLKFKTYTTLPCAGNVGRGENRGYGMGTSLQTVRL